MRHSNEATATKNRRLASRLSDHAAAFASTVALESRHDVKPDDTRHYRTSARASERSWQTLHNSLVAGKKNPYPPSGGDSPRHRACAAGCGTLTFANTLPIATSLCSSAAFTLFTGPITTVRCPPTPAAGRRPARRTAIAAERVPRPEALLATFQKTEAIAKTPWDVLHRSRFSVTLRWAHGMLCSLTVKSRCEAPTSQRGVFIHPPHFLPRQSLNLPG